MTSAGDESTWTRRLNRFGPLVWMPAILTGISLVAYADWKVVTNISLGYLYLLPLVLAATTIRRRSTLAVLVVVSAVLREWLGPFEHTGFELVIRMAVVLSVLALVVYFVSRLQSRREHLSDVVREQRDQLTRDLQEAAAVQRLLIPDHLPDLPGWDLAARLYPARIVAGDFFDVIWDESRKHFAMVVADVAGKGAAAAMLMPVVQATVRRLHLRGRPPDELAAALNKAIVGLTDHPRFVSVVYFKFDGQTGDFEYVNMGHPPPVRVSRRSESGSETGPVWLACGGPVAGAVAAARYEVGQGTLAVGDTLLLYTDGATEVENSNGDPFAEDGLVRVLSQQGETDASTVLDVVHDAVERFRAERSNRDDMTLMVIRRVQEAST